MGAFRNVIIKFDRGIQKAIWTQFSEENNFICLLVRIWIKLHFPLITPVTVFSRPAITSLIFLCSKPLRKGKFHLQIFYTLNLFHQVDHLCILKTKVALVLKNKSGHCGTPDFIFLHSDVWPFKTTLCSWLSW